MVALLGKRRLYGPKDKKFTTSEGTRPARAWAGIFLAVLDTVDSLSFLVTLALGLVGLHANLTKSCGSPAESVHVFCPTLV
jgi:hypothetical protein